MSYSVFIKDDHVYDKSSGVVDGLDIVRITKDETFINNVRLFVL